MQKGRRRGDKGSARVRGGEGGRTKAGEWRREDKVARIVTKGWEGGVEGEVRPRSKAPPDPKPE